MTNTPTVAMPELKMIALTAILPSRLDEELSLSSRKTATIRASIQEFGIIEPLLVFPIARTNPQQYLLVDGHLRLSILNAMKVTEILCLITHDDETYSVDACVSALAPIQA
jgi:ParB-like chromosome segregation protein Spo0J